MCVNASMKFANMLDPSEPMDSDSPVAITTPTAQARMNRIFLSVYA